MPRFYLHLRNDLSVDDEEGQELPDVEAAREAALENTRSIVCENIRLGHVNLDHYIDVMDDQGAHVLRLSFRDAFTIEGRY
jgi:hypothetical protein